MSTSRKACCIASIVTFALASAPVLAEPQTPADLRPGFSLPSACSNVPSPRTTRMLAEYLIPAFAENEAPANSERCTDRSIAESAASINAIDDPPVVIHPPVPPAAKSEIDFHPVEPSFDQFTVPQRAAISRARACVV